MAGASRRPSVARPRRLSPGTTQHRPLAPARGLHTGENRPQRPGQDETCHNRDGHHPDSDSPAHQHRHGETTTRENADGTWAESYQQRTTALPSSGDGKIKQPTTASPLPPRPHASAVGYHRKLIFPLRWMLRNVTFQSHPNQRSPLANRDDDADAKPVSMTHHPRTLNRPETAGRNQHPRDATLSLPVPQRQAS